MGRDDRREHDRVSIRVGIEVKSSSVEEFVERYIRDISEGGVFLELDQPLPEGTRIEFKLRIDEESPLIAGIGRVAWVRPAGATADDSPGGVGVEFEELDEASSDLVSSFVERRRDDVGEFEKGG